MDTVSQFNYHSMGQIGPLEKIDNDIHTAVGTTPTGEKIYFAMETIENTDKSKWNVYKNTAAMLVHGGACDITIGSLAELGSRVDDQVALQKFLSQQSHPDFWTTDPCKFEQLCANLRTRKISVNSPKAKELLAIPHASNGMNVDRQTHVVYVSKSRVTGRINFAAHSKGWFGKIVDKYSNLIMSVGVAVSDVVENRGIFRNPLSVIEGGYGSIAMMIHSFTCMAIESTFPQVSVFRVRPLKKMGEIFLKALPKDQVTINGIRGDVYDGGFENEQDVRVPVRVLAQLYR